MNVMYCIYPPTIHTVCIIQPGSPVADRGSLVLGEAGSDGNLGVCMYMAPGHRKVPDLPTYIHTYCRRPVAHSILRSRHRNNKSVCTTYVPQYICTVRRPQKQYRHVCRVECYAL